MEEVIITIAVLFIGAIIGIVVIVALLHFFADLTLRSKCGQSTKLEKLPPQRFLTFKDSQYAPNGAMVALSQMILPSLKKFKSIAQRFRWMDFMVLERPVLT